MTHATHLPSAQPAVLRVFDREYTPLENGKGGMGQVYVDAQYETVIKIVPFDAFRSSTLSNLFQHRLVTEAFLGMNLSHDYLSQVLKITSVPLQYDNRTYALQFPYYQGGSLEERFFDQRIDLAEYFRACSQTAQALDYLHSENIVHRDVKALNIFRDNATNRYRLGDLGISRPRNDSDLLNRLLRVYPQYRELINLENQPSFYVGTLATTPPEQVEGSNKSYSQFRTNPTPGYDIFSLGTVIWQALAAVPFIRAIRQASANVVPSADPYGKLEEKEDPLTRLTTLGLYNNRYRDTAIDTLESRIRTHWGNDLADVLMPKSTSIPKSLTLPVFFQSVFEHNPSKRPSAMRVAEKAERLADHIESMGINIMQYPKRSPTLAMFSLPGGTNFVEVDSFSSIYVVEGVCTLQDNNNSTNGLGNLEHSALALAPLASMRGQPVAQQRM